MSRRLVERIRTGPDGGFTLIEVLVALSIFAIAAAALIPLLLVSGKAAGTARLETQAKNLTQQQIERMRNLTFHVAHENGDYVDLLDLYYTNVLPSAVTLTPTSTPRDSASYQDADGNVTVQYLADAGGLGGKPSGPAYRVSDLQFIGYPSLSLDVYTQFLRTTRTVATPNASYDSQVASLDSPPAQLVGITILATWRDGSGPQTYRTYTEMADGRGVDALLSTQARATAIKVTGTDTTGNNLLLQAGVVQADGSVTSGSSANVAAESARIEQVGVTTSLGQASTTSAPPSPSGSNAVSSTLGPQKLGSGSCGWGSIGSTQVSNVSASTGMQQPLIPSDGGTDVRSASAKRVQAGVLVGGSGCSGYNVAFRPDADDSWSPPSTYGVDENKPLVGVPDTGGSNTLSNAAVRASGQVAASPLVTTPIFSSAYASARTKQLTVLPVSGFSNGLVQVTLNSSSMTCVSGSTTSAAYDLTVNYPTGSQTITWSSATPTVPLLPAPATVAFTVDGVPRTLADYLSWSVASGVAEGTNGVSTFGPVMRLTINKAVIGTATDVTLEMGVLSCVADDRR